MKRRKKKTTRRPRPKKKAAAKRTRQARRVSIHAASPARRAKLFRALRTVMKAHGVTDEIAAVHLTPSAAAAPKQCPPGQVSRIVCVKKPDGTVVCRSECQPI